MDAAAKLSKAMQDLVSSTKAVMINPSNQQAQKVKSLSLEMKYRNTHEANYPLHCRHWLKQRGSWLLLRLRSRVQEWGNNHPQHLNKKAQSDL